MNTQTLTMIIIVGLVLIWAIVRQILPRKVSRFPFIILPIIGVYEAVKSMPQPVIPAHQLLEAAIALSISVVIGFLQAHVTTVYTESDGQVYMRGGWLYLGLWILLIASRVVTDIAFQQPGQPGSSFAGVGWILWADLAVVWGIRGIVLCVKHPEIRSQLSQGRRRQRDAY